MIGSHCILQISWHRNLYKCMVKSVDHTHTVHEVTFDDLGDLQVEWTWKWVDSFGQHVRQAKGELHKSRWCQVMVTWQCTMVTGPCSLVLVTACDDHVHQSTHVMIMCTKAHMWWSCAPRHTCDDHVHQSTHVMIMCTKAHMWWSCAPRHTCYKSLTLAVGSLPLKLLHERWYIVILSLPGSR